MAQRATNVKPPEPVYKNIVEETLLRQTQLWFYNRKLKSTELKSIGQQLIIERKKSNRKNYLKFLQSIHFLLRKNFFLIWLVNIRQGTEEL